MVKGLNIFRDRFRQFEGSFTSRYDITTYTPLRHWKVGPGSESWRRGSPNANCFSLGPNDPTKARRCPA